MGPKTVTLSALICLYSVVITCTGQSTSCSNGFIDPLNIPSSSRRFRTSQQRVITGITFTCNGSVTSWTIGANWRRGGGRNSYPYLLIWRSTGDNSYRLEGRTRLFVPNDGRSNGNYIFDGNPDPPLQFQAGDVLGIFQPRNQRSLVRLYFERETSPINYVMTADDVPPLMNSFTTTDGGVGVDRDLPEITVELTIDCGNLRDPDGGQVTITGGLVPTAVAGVNATARYACQQGYNLVGEPVRTCRANGVWDGTEPICSVIDCGSLGNPKGGEVTITGGLVRGTEAGVDAVATYSCNVGYDLVGEALRTCQATGLWDGAMPSCLLADCGLLLPPANGNVMQRNTTFASVTEYSCNDGFELVGNSTRTCQASGAWSGAEPTCESSEESNGGIGEGNTPQSDSMSDSMIPLIASVAVGVIATALLTVAIIVAVIIVMKRRKRGKARIKSAENKVGDFDNPLYSGDVSGRYIDTMRNGARSNETTLYEEPPQNYETPQRRNIYSTLSDDIQMFPPAAAYEVPLGTLQAMTHSYCVALEVEQGLAQTLLKKLKSSESECSLLIAAKSLNPLYEWDIYVPTQKQREALGTISSEAERAYYVADSIYTEVQSAAREPATPTSAVFFEETDTYWAPSSIVNELYEQLATRKYREIPRDQIQTNKHLGTGQFGTVNKGVWQSSGQSKEVAIKMLKAGTTEEEKVKFLQEAAINGQFKHPNIVQLLGVVTVGEPMMIVLEFLPNGDLRDYLIRHKPAPGELIPSDVPAMLLRFCREVASGMEYLTRKAFVHRDLAARNVLVAKNKVCKISDFGMSRDLMDENYYVSHGGKVPVKWTAPEALHYKRYTAASDVWSYGVVMYEIWSLGCKPFEGYTNQQAIRQVDNGHRLPPPPGCPRALYQVMIQCWHPKKSSRPSFTQVIVTLSEHESKLLSWAVEDTQKLHPQATALGAPLEAGRDLYPDLQQAYRA